MRLGAAQPQQQQHRPSGLLQSAAMLALARTFVYSGLMVAAALKSSACLHSARSQAGTEPVSQSPQWVQIAQRRLVGWSGQWHAAARLLVPMVESRSTHTPANAPALPAGQDRPVQIVQLTRGCR